ncbi:hypothetical protein PCCS19_25850 [Paenibacillus sp. CCS19]|uniref:hypothetical protein n=1 Tax=Paenibacillus sp. CCS19 TaxID=3158387 RepID=UPI002561A0E0|nr:hypothetical protein [Paenibacillus cellulosilyticus]GMK39531.1 hypothetical protein PCCS19_25850 [Paenibacillus cellulosilyticus]
MKQTIKLLLLAVVLAGTLSACDREIDRAASSVTPTNADQAMDDDSSDSTDSPTGVELGTPPLPSHSHGNEAATSDEIMEHDHAGMSSDSHASHDGMELSASEEDGDVQVVLAPEAGALMAGEDAELTIRILGEDGEPITKFALSHEKLLHLIIVSEDMQQFRHIHPGYDGEGVFRVMTQFTSGGRYKWFADFVPDGGHSMTRAGWLTIGGKPTYDLPAPQPDASLVQKVDGIEIALAVSEAEAGENATLTYTFRDAKTGKELTDMENYLGAAGHVVILSKDMETYLHVHPKEHNSGSSSASFTTVFPADGIYKVWGQFQREGRVVTVPFVIQVE